MKRKAREWQERQVSRRECEREFSAGKKTFERKEISPGIQNIKRAFENEKIEKVPVIKKKVSRVEEIRETFEVKTKWKEVNRETVKESTVRQMASPFEQMMNIETRKKADIREKERGKKKDGFIFVLVLGCAFCIPGSSMV